MHHLPHHHASIASDDTFSLCSYRRYVYLALIFYNPLPQVSFILQEIEVVELNEPAGWVKIPLKDLNDKLVRTFMVQIAVINNHQQGRDTHLRQIEIHSPVEERAVTSAGVSNWATKDCMQFMHMR